MGRVSLRKLCPRCVLFPSPQGLAHHAQGAVRKIQTTQCPGLREMPTLELKEQLWFSPSSTTCCPISCPSTHLITPLLRPILPITPPISQQVLALIAKVLSTRPTLYSPPHWDHPPSHTLSPPASNSQNTWYFFKPQLKHHRLQEALSGPASCEHPAPPNPRNKITFWRVLYLSCLF